MSKYIDRHSVIGKIWVLESDCFENKTIRDVIDIIDSMPAADVVEVARPVGEWEYYKQGLVRCSECHDCYIDEMYITREKWKFCPTCGARLEHVGNCKA